MDERELIQIIPELRGKQLTISPLEGGLTNRNYRIDAEDASYVLRIAGHDTALLGIDRHCEAACSRAAAALGVGPEVIGCFPERDILLRRFVAGKQLEEEDIRKPRELRRIVEVLRRYHEGPPVEGRFSPFATVRNYRALAAQRRVQFPDDLGLALERLSWIERELQTEEPLCPCHNDLLAGNFIDDGKTLRIIDWEYGGMGDRFFDLGNLAVNNEFSEEHECALLELYFGEVNSDQLRRLRLMRLASDMREAMWGFLQSAISKLDIDYVAYGHRHLHRFFKGAFAAA